MKISNKPSLLTGMKKLSTDKHPTGDLFVADIWDAALKDDVGSMEHPFFSLSKKPDHTRRVYTHGNNTLEVTPSYKGMATIWDKDILIYCVSQVVQGINLNRPVSNRIELVVHNLLATTNRSIGGDGYAKLVQAFERLAGTRIKTNIQTGNIIERESFGLIQHWRVVEKTEINGKRRMVKVEVTLTDWFYRAAMNMEVLTIHPDYFRLKGGIERRLYEICRKHCGSQSTWKIGIELLYKKSGSRSPLATFRHAIKAIVEATMKENENGRLNYPDYLLSYDSEKDQLVCFNKKDKSATYKKYLLEIKEQGFNDAFEAMDAKASNKKRN